MEDTRAVKMYWQNVREQNKINLTMFSPQSRPEKKNWNVVICSIEKTTNTF